jgi:hypothetical protein
VKFARHRTFRYAVSYASSIARVLQHFDLRADARVSECRAGGARKGCLLSVVVLGPALTSPRQLRD